MRKHKIHYTNLECDMPMRRAKERHAALAKEGIPTFKCNSKCRECVCCIGTRTDGTREHITPGV